MWWLTVGAYGVTAVLCFLVSIRITRSAWSDQRNFWYGTAVAMLLLGVNKQQDLTGILTRLARNAAWQERWYFSRQPVQLALIAVAGLMFGLLFLLLLHRVKPASRGQGIALLGIVFLTGFALIRAVSLHAIDTFLYRRVAGLQPNWIVELGGLALVALPAVIGLIQSQPTKDLV